MTRCKLVAFTRPLPGREADFNEWYQNVHLPQVVETFKMHGAQRYKLVAKMSGADENDYMALYDVDCDDPHALVAAIGKLAQSGEMRMTDSIDPGTAYTALFEECGEPLVGG